MALLLSNSSPLFRYRSSRRSTEGNVVHYSDSSKASDSKIQKEESKEEILENQDTPEHREVHQKKRPIKLFSSFQAADHRSEDTLTFRSERDDIEAAVSAFTCARIHRQKVRIFSYLKSSICPPVFLKL